MIAVLLKDDKSLVVHCHKCLRERQKHKGEEIMKQNLRRLHGLLAGFLLAAALLLGMAPAARAEEIPERILNIYKSAGEEPLANVQIDLYLAAPMEALAEGAVTLSPKPTREELELYQRPENRVATVITDAQGFATYNFTQNGQPDGVYLVVEQPAQGLSGPVAPFYITIPAATQEGEQYTMDVHLKSTVETGPSVNQDVCAIDNDSGSFAVGQPHTWILRGGIPEGLAAAREYVLNDLLDPRLSLEPGSGLVILHTRDGKQRPLRVREHYELEEGKGSLGGQRCDRLRLALTPAGMAYVAANLGEGTYTPEIRLSFRVSINHSASMGCAMSGQAQLTYTNSAGITYETDADRPEVHTGGLHMALTDGIFQPLPGGTFRLARLADENEGNREMLYINGKQEQVVFVPFYKSADLRGEPVTEMTTGRDGLALAYGLPYGSYYLVEAEAPDGFNRMTLPIPVTVNEVSHLTMADGWTDPEGQGVDNTISVVNTKLVLPETGGMGTFLFTVIGACMVGAACTMLIRSRRKR